ncbi:MAG: tetratricopeptide repeat protein [Granulosicoccus sp.]|nr:tetratricopeptide repeat protein [Granulosicoccus sp.]
MKANKKFVSDLERAIQFHQQGNNVAAKALYQKLLNQESDHPDLLHFYGLYCFQYGEQDKGIRYVRKCLQLNPQYPDACNNLGNMLKLSGKLEEAEEMYHKALELNPQSADAMINLGVLARSRQAYDEALEWNQRAIAINPDNGIAYNNLARLLMKLGKTRLALEVLNEAVKKVVKFDASSEETHVQRARLMLILGNKDEAEEIYRDWLNAYPDSKRAQHMLAAVTGVDVPEKSDPDYVKVLFDRFSSSFDEVLDRLDYKAPEIVGARVARYYTTDQPAEYLLDAGCGTGLCGTFLRGITSNMFGVDLSPGMLQRASQRELYDDLIEMELVAYLNEVPDRFDAIVSADTLNYFGDLSEVFAATARSLKPGGRFVFTLEQHEAESNESFNLNSHGRYSHSLSYVSELLSQSGFDLPESEQVVLRTELAIPVSGMVIVTRKPL